MNLISRICQIVIASTFALVLTFVVPGDVLAQQIETTPASIYLATANTDIGQKTKATVKKIEGKVQETVGNITEDRETQIKGKVNQAEGAIRAVPSDRFGNPTNVQNSEAEIEGKVQQAESNIRRYQAR